MRLNYSIRLLKNQLGIYNSKEQHTFLECGDPPHRLLPQCREDGDLGDVELHRLEKCLPLLSTDPSRLPDHRGPRQGHREGRVADCLPRGAQLSVVDVVFVRTIPSS